MVTSLTNEWACLKTVCKHLLYRNTVVTMLVLVNLSKIYYFFRGDGK